MNLILLEQEDFTGAARVRIGGRRFAHARAVLRAELHDVLAVGVLAGRIGQGRIVRVEETCLEMEVRLEKDPPAALPVTIILALPRPKALRRVLFTLAVLGVKKIVLVNAARIEKSYWQSPYLGERAVRKQLLLGLEQAGDTVLPEVLLRPRFRPFVEDELRAMSAGTLALVAHPAAEAPVPREVRQPATVAVGPEGGFVPYELALFRSLGFTPVTLGRRILNVESAVPAVLARLF